MPDPDTSHLSLYHFESCPFCQRVRAVIDRLGLEIELRDIRADAAHRAALAEGGGSTQVPCLRIEKDGDVQWLYESADIARYLTENFS